MQLCAERYALHQIALVCFPPIDDARTLRFRGIMAPILNA